MKKVLLFLALFGLASADDEALRVVYDLTTSSVAKFEQKVLQGIVSNKAHYADSFKELDVSVVIHGGAYRFFLEDLNNTEYQDDIELIKAHSNLKKRIATLAETYNVEFLICGLGMTHHKLSKKNLFKFVKVIPNASIGLIDKQNEGFAYLRADD